MCIAGACPVSDKLLRQLKSNSTKNPGSGAVQYYPLVNQPPTGTLWYNGDFDGVDGLTNEENTFATGYSHIYDDFEVTDAEGWDVDSVFSDNLSSTNITSATWEIRQGVSAFNGGTIVASGMTVTPVVTPTGRSGFGFTEFMVQVTGLSVHLDPGTYWLNVTPVDSLDGGRSFDSTTSGANCIGTPCGDNDDAFLDSTLFGAVFEPVADFGGQFHDFSMGVIGTVSSGGLTLDSAASIQRGFAVDLPLSGVWRGRSLRTTEQEIHDQDDLQQ